MYNLWGFCIDTLKITHSLIWLRIFPMGILVLTPIITFTQVQSIRLKNSKNFDKFEVRFNMEIFCKSLDNYEKQLYIFYVVPVQRCGLSSHPSEQSLYPSHMFQVMYCILIKYWCIPSQDNTITKSINLKYFVLVFI